MNRVIARALNREVLKNWLLVLLLLWFVLLSGRFSLNLAQAAAGQLPGSMVPSLTLLKSLGFAVFAMPVAFFFAVLMALGRWNRDLESVALAASGFSTPGYIRLLLPAAFLLALTNAVLSLYVVPETIHLGNELKARATQAADIKLWKAGRFISLQDGKLLLFADQLADDGETMENVFLQFHDGKTQTLVSAKRAVRYIDEKTNQRYVMLQEGYRYDGVPGQADYRQMKFDEYGLRIGDVQSASFKWKAVATRDLWKSEELAGQLELQNRFMRPVSILVLLGAGVILGRYLPGRGYYTSIIAGIFIFVIYYNLTGVAQSEYAEGKFASGIGIWWIHAVPLLLALIIDYLQRWRSVGKR